MSTPAWKSTDSTFLYCWSGHHATRKAAHKQRAYDQSGCSSTTFISWNPPARYLSNIRIRQLVTNCAWYPSRLSLPHCVSTRKSLWNASVLTTALDDSQIEFLVEAQIPSINARVELEGGSLLRFQLIHPTPPVPGENPSSTERDVVLLVLAKTLQDSAKRIIVTGDLNDVAWSATTRLFRRVSGLLDPRTKTGMVLTLHADWWFALWPLSIT